MKKQVKEFSEEKTPDNTENKEIEQVKEQQKEKEQEKEVKETEEIKILIIRKQKIKIKNKQ